MPASAPPGHLASRRLPPRGPIRRPGSHTRANRTAGRDPGCAPLPRRPHGGAPGPAEPGARGREGLGRRAGRGAGRRPRSFPAFPALPGAQEGGSPQPLERPLGHSRSSRPPGPLLENPWESGATVNPAGRRALGWAESRPTVAPSVRTQPSVPQGPAGLPQPGHQRCSRFWPQQTPRVQDTAPQGLSAGSVRSARWLACSRLPSTKLQHPGEQRLETTSAPERGEPSLTASATLRASRERPSFPRSPSPSPSSGKSVPLRL